MRRGRADQVRPVIRLDTDPRIVVTAEDAAAVMEGREYTPTDLQLIEAGTHPYHVTTNTQEVDA